MSDDIKKVLEEVLDSRSRVPQEQHTEHHEWLETMRPFINRLIEEKKKKQDMWDKVKTQVLVGGVTGILAAIGTAVYHFFFKHGGH